MKCVKRCRFNAWHCKPWIWETNLLPEWKECVWDTVILKLGIASNTNQHNARLRIERETKNRRQLVRLHSQIINATNISCEIRSFRVVHRRVADSCLPIRTHLCSTLQLTLLLSRESEQQAQNNNNCARLQIWLGINRLKRGITTKTLHQ